MSVCFSSDGRQIFSAGCDSKITLWNTKGEQKMVSTQDNHNDWISKIRYSPSAKNKFYASVGWDGKLKTWTEFFKSGDSVVAHDGPINGLAINTNGAYIATGGKDQVLKIWKSNEL